MSQANPSLVKAELDRLTAEFFHAVSFEAGGVPPYEKIYALFIEPGLLIKNTGSVMPNPSNERTPKGLRLLVSVRPQQQPTCSPPCQANTIA